MSNNMAGDVGIVISSVCPCSCLFVCLSVCLFMQKLKNYWQGIDVTLYQYVFRAVEMGFNNLGFRFYVFKEKNL